ncbi:peroxiredoxin [uncultured Jatrophihabitans sp.]|uniref:peroxiredoxin n=1 Tax=uncultured Jatrophihabitans sp. TaxID=1610747 RepID=UPI0035C9B022
MTQVGRPFPTIASGDVAPDFTLHDQNNEEIALRRYRGDRAVLVIFYPLAFTGVCTGELARVRDDLDTFQNDDVQTLAISVDSVYAHKIFAEREGYDFPLLSDFWPHGAVAASFGAFDTDTGVANRGTYLVDRSGIVRYTELNRPGQPRNADDWVAAITAL